MSNGIDQLSVRDLLGGAPQAVANYVVPMYQRNYAWGEGEITQLIQDVLDEMLKQTTTAGRVNPYYIGTLVVFNKKSDSDHPLYEVIDGQQRLTTLFLLASFFRNSADIARQALREWFQNPCVQFESRPHSSKTLLAVFNGQAENSDAQTLHTEAYNRDILNGYELIQRLLPKLCEENGASLRAFADYLFHYGSSTLGVEFAP